MWSMIRGIQLYQPFQRSKTMSGRENESRIALFGVMCKHALEIFHRIQVSAAYVYVCVERCRDTDNR